MKKTETSKGVIPVWKRYALTITEAADYYHIGEKICPDNCRGGGLLP